MSMWIKSEANRNLYNLDWCHTIEVIKKGTKYYVVALFEGSSVNSQVHLGDVNVAQITHGTTEIEEAHVVLGRITRAMGIGVLNLDTAESRKASRPAVAHTHGNAMAAAQKNAEGSNGEAG